MSFINKQRLSDIRGVVSNMANEIFCHQSHPLPPGRECTIGLIKMKAAPVNIGPFDHTAVRATFQPLSNSIVLTGFPLGTEEYDNIGAPREDVEAWFEHIVAHEVCHAEQFAANPSLFAPGQPGDDASKRGQKAEQTREPLDYLHYVEHDLEIEAHGVQLAVQVLQADPGLDEDHFKSACRSMHLYCHISQKGTPEGGYCNQSNQLTNYLERLIVVAWQAYQQLI